MSVATLVLISTAFWAVTSRTLAVMLPTESPMSMLPLGAASVMFVIDARDSTGPLIVRLPLVTFTLT